MIRVFIGFDPREAVACNVLTYSIARRATAPVSIAPIMLSQLSSTYTDFSFSRFLTPYLSGYEGWSLFMDCDMLVLDDIAKLWALRDSRYAVQVVKHDHRPKETIKFLGAEQVPYEKKNWSSVMLFNNAMCRALTPEFVNTATGLELHQFKWLAGDHLIGELPSKWNHLVGYDAHIPDASLVHYTIGGPYFPAYEDCAYGDEWRAEREAMLYALRG
jgi:lipopolysaccharide biosynthesis glycosyltransferase